LAFWHGQAELQAAGIHNDVSLGVARIAQALLYSFRASVTSALAANAQVG
jgi:hypothetical protein